MQAKLRSRRWLVELLKKVETSHFKTYSDVQVSWEDFKTRAKATKDFLYDCQIDANGQCQRTRREGAVGVRRAKMNCCVGCLGAYGYLHQIPKGSAEKYARYWNSKTGFWREGKGCNLPRSMRSETCLSFHCRPSWVRVVTHPSGWCDLPYMNVHAWLGKGKPLLPQFIQIKGVN